MAREIVIGAKERWKQSRTSTNLRVANSVSTQSPFSRGGERLRVRAAPVEFKSDFPQRTWQFLGVVGRYLTDSVGSDLTWVFSAAGECAAHNHDGVGGMHMYMPWWGFGRKNNFLRGYHIEFGGGRDMPGVGEFDGSAKKTKVTESA